jgi:hypothetical protein
MPVELPPIDTVSPTKALGKAFIGLARIWNVLKWFLLAGGIIFVLGLVVLWIIRSFRKKPTIVSNIMYDKEKSAVQTKRPNVKDVYLCSDFGLGWIGTYEGEYSSDKVYYVLIKKKKEFPILKKMPDILYNFFIKIFYLVCTTEKSLKVFSIDGKDVLLIYGLGLKYDGIMKHFIVEGHGGLPRIVLDSVLADSKKEYLYEFVKQTGGVMASAFEINPFLKARLKMAQEKEEKEGDEEEEEK